MLLVPFIMSQAVVSAPAGFASPETVKDTPSLLLKAQSPVERISLPELKIPKTLGTVSGRWDSPGEGFGVIYIQDAHSVPSAQRSIMRLAGHLQRKYGLSTIAVEGTDRDFNPVIFRSFPDPKRVRRVFKDYVDSGELSGAVAAAVLSPKTLRVTGIENKNLYADAVKAYLDGLDSSEDLERQVTALRKSADELVEKHFSPTARAVYDILAGWEADRRTLPEVLEELSVIAEPEPGAYPALASLREAAILDRVKNGKLIRSRIDQSVRWLLSQSTDAGFKARLNDRYQAFLTEALSLEAFSEFLKQAAAGLPAGDRKSAAGEIETLSIHIESLKTIEGTPLFREWEDYLRLVKSEAYVSSAEKAIDAVLEKITAAGKLVRMELTYTQWSALNAPGEAGTIQADTEIQALGGAVQALLRGSGTGPSRRFYELALRREAQFAGRLHELVWQAKKRWVLFIGGGFHSDGLVRELQHRGLKVVTIQPRIDAIPENDLYRAHMQGQVSWGRYLARDGGRETDLFRAFSQAAVDRLMEGKNWEEIYEPWSVGLQQEILEAGRLSDSGDILNFFQERVLENKQPGILDQRKNGILDKAGALLGELEALDAGGSWNAGELRTVLDKFSATQNPYAVPAGSIPRELLRRAGEASEVRAELRSSGKQIWPAQYRDGRAQFLDLRTALAMHEPPAGWWQSPGVLQPLWFAEDRSGKVRTRKALDQLLDAAFDKLYQTREELTADERRAIQARFLENLFVRLAGQDPDARHLTTVAGWVGLSENMPYWWAQTGLARADGFTGATIKLEYAVRLARKALNKHGRHLGWKMIAQVLGDDSLTPAQVARIWNVEVSNPLLLANKTPRRPKAVDVYQLGYAKHRFLKDVLQGGVPPASWVAQWGQDKKPLKLKPLWFDSALTARPTPMEELRRIYGEIENKLFQSQEVLTGTERSVLKCILSEGLFYKWVQKFGKDDYLRDIAALTGVSQRTVQWWAEGGMFKLTPAGEERGIQKFTGSSIPFDHAVTIARQVIDQRGGPSDERLIAKAFGDLSLTSEQIARIWKDPVRSELRLADFSNLDAVDWKTVPKAKQAAFVSHLLREVLKITPQQLVDEPGLMVSTPLPGWGAQTLKSLHDHYEAVRQAAGGEFSAVETMLFDLDFQGFKARATMAERYRHRDKYTDEAREKFSEVAQKINLPVWLDLFRDNRAGLFHLLLHLTDPSGKDPDSYLALLNERFWDEDTRAIGPREPFSLEKLAAMAPVLAELSFEDDQHVLLSEITKQIAGDLNRLAVENEREGKSGKSAARLALEFAQQWFERELQQAEPELNAGVRVLYEKLWSYYAEIEEADYQQYVKKSPDPAAQKYLTLEQLEGIHFAVKNKRVIIADEMGFGKTVEALIAAQAMKTERIVIVASATVIRNWADEIQEWLEGTQLLQWEKPGFMRSRKWMAGGQDPRADAGGIAIVDADERLEKIKAAQVPGVKFVLINYEGLRIKDEATRKKILFGAEPGVAEDVDENVAPAEVSEQALAEDDDSAPARDIQIIQEVRNYRPGLVIVDEGHHLTNPAAQQTAGLLALQSDSEWKVRSDRPFDVIWLTGTPLRAELGNLGPALHFLAPDEFKSPVMTNTRARQNSGEYARFHTSVLGRFMMRRLTPNLPKLTLHPVMIEMTPEQKDLLVQLMHKYEISNGDAAALQKFMDMQRLGLGVDFVAGTPVDGGHPVPKVQWTQEFLRDTWTRNLRAADRAPDRVAVMPHFNDLADRFSFDWNAGAAGSLRLPPGQVASLRYWHKPADRARIVKKANEDPGIWVFLTTGKLAGEGLNLTGFNILILPQIPPSFVQFDQWIKRLHRVGQKRDVDVYVLICSAAGDQELLDIINKRRQFFDEVVQGTLGLEGIKSAHARASQQAVEGALTIQHVLGELQVLLAIQRGSGRTDAARRRWDAFAQSYSDALENMAAMAHSQLLLTHLLNLHKRKGGFEFKKGQRIGFGPLGPLSDLRAWSKPYFAKLFYERTGLTLSDFQFEGADFSPAMIRIAREWAARLGLSVNIHQADLVGEDFAKAHQRERWYDLNISSEVGSYSNDNLNSHGVGQRNMMIANTVRSVRKGGHVLLWTHNGRIDESKALPFLAKLGLKKVSGGALSLTDSGAPIPAALKKSCEGMTFLLMRVEEEVEMTPDFLRGLDPEGFTIENRVQAPTVMSGDAVLYVLESGPRKGSRDLSAYLEKGSRVEHMDKAPAVENRLSPLDGQLLNHKQTLVELLFKTDPGTAEAERLRQHVEAILNLKPDEANEAAALPREQYLKDILSLLRSAQDSDPLGWNARYSGLLEELCAHVDAAIRRLQGRETEMKLAQGGQERGKKKGPAEGRSRHGQPVSPDITQDGDLLTFFVRNGYHFLIEEEHGGYYSQDIYLDQETKTFWVNSALLASKKLTASDIRTLLNWKAHLYLDVLFPDHPSAAALLVGLSRLQDRFQRASQEGQDLELLARIDIPYLINFLLRLRQLSETPLNNQPEKFEETAGGNPYRAFVEQFRLSGTELVWGSLEAASLERVHAFVNETLESENRQAVLLKDFITRHGKHFRSYLPGRENCLEIEMTRLDNGDQLLTLAYTGKERPRTELATAILKSGDAGGAVDWNINLALAEFPEFAGTYSPKPGDISYSFTSAKGIGYDQAVTLKAEQIAKNLVKEPVILREESASAEGARAVLVRKLTDSSIGLFLLRQEGERWLLEGDSLKPAGVLHLDSRTVEILSTGSPLNSRFRVLASGDVVIARNRDIGYGNNTFSWARFSAAKRERTEMRFAERVARAGWNETAKSLWKATVSAWGNTLLWDARENQEYPIRSDAARREAREAERLPVLSRVRQEIRSMVEASEKYKEALKQRDAGELKTALLTVQEAVQILAALPDSALVAINRKTALQLQTEVETKVREEEAKKEEEIDLRAVAAALMVYEKVEDGTEAQDPADAIRGILASFRLEQEKSARAAERALFLLGVLRRESFMRLEDYAHLERFRNVGFELDLAKGAYRVTGEALPALIESARALIRQTREADLAEVFRDGMEAADGGILLNQGQEPEENVAVIRWIVAYQIAGIYRKAVLRKPADEQPPCPGDLAALLGIGEAEVNALAERIAALTVSSHRFPLSQASPLPAADIPKIQPYLEQVPADVSFIQDVVPLAESVDGKDFGAILDFFRSTVAPARDVWRLFYAVVEEKEWAFMTQLLLNLSVNGKPDSFDAGDRNRITAIYNGIISNESVWRAYDLLSRGAVIADRLMRELVEPSADGAQETGALEFPAFLLRIRHLFQNPYFESKQFKVAAARIAGFKPSPSHLSQPLPSLGISAPDDFPELRAWLTPSGPAATEELSAARQTLKRHALQNAFRVLDFRYGVDPAEETMENKKKRSKVHKTIVDRLGVNGGTAVYWRQGKTSAQGDHEEPRIADTKLIRLGMLALEGLPGATHPLSVMRQLLGVPDLSEAELAALLPKLDLSELGDLRVLEQENAMISAASPFFVRLNRLGAEAETSQALEKFLTRLLDYSKSVYGDDARMKGVTGFLDRTDRQLEEKKSELERRYRSKPAIFEQEWDHNIAPFAAVPFARVRRHIASLTLTGNAQAADSRPGDVTLAGQLDHHLLPGEPVREVLRELFHRGWITLLEAREIAAMLTSDPEERGNLVRALAKTDSAKPVPPEIKQAALHLTEIIQGLDWQALKEVQGEKIYGQMITAAETGTSGKSDRLISPEEARLLRSLVKSPDSFLAQLSAQERPDKMVRKVLEVTRKIAGGFQTLPERIVSGLHLEAVEEYRESISGFGLPSSTDLLTRLAEWLEAQVPEASVSPEDLTAYVTHSGIRFGDGEVERVVSLTQIEDAQKAAEAVRESKRLEIEAQIPALVARFFEDDAGRFDTWKQWLAGLEESMTAYLRSRFQFDPMAASGLLGRSFSEFVSEILRDKHIDPLSFALLKSWQGLERSGDAVDSAALADGVKTTMEKTAAGADVALIGARRDELNQILRRPIQDREAAPNAGREQAEAAVKHIIGDSTPELTLTNLYYEHLENLKNRGLPPTLNQLRKLYQAQDRSARRKGQPSIELLIENVNGALRKAGFRSLTLLSKRLPREVLLMVTLYDPELRTAPFGRLARIVDDRLSRTFDRPGSGDRVDAELLYLQLDGGFYEPRMKELLRARPDLKNMLTDYLKSAAAWETKKLAAAERLSRRQLALERQAKYRRMKLWLAEPANAANAADPYDYRDACLLELQITEDEASSFVADAQLEDNDLFIAWAYWHVKDRNANPNWTDVDNILFAQGLNEVHPVAIDQGVERLNDFTEAGVFVLAPYVPSVEPPNHAAVARKKDEPKPKQAAGGYAILRIDGPDLYIYFDELYAGLMAALETRSRLPLEERIIREEDAAVIFPSRHQIHAYKKPKQQSQATVELVKKGYGPLTKGAIVIGIDYQIPGGQTRHTTLTLGTPQYQQIYPWLIDDSKAGREWVRKLRVTNTASLSWLHAMLPHEEDADVARSEMRSTPFELSTIQDGKPFAFRSELRDEASDAKAEIASAVRQAEEGRADFQGGRFGEAREKIVAASGIFARLSSSGGEGSVKTVAGYNWAVARKLEEQIVAVLRRQEEALEAERDRKTILAAVSVERLLKLGSGLSEREQTLLDLEIDAVGVSAEEAAAVRSAARTLLVILRGQVLVFLPDDVVLLDRLEKAGLRIDIAHETYALSEELQRALAKDMQVVASAEPRAAEPEPAVSPTALAGLSPLQTPPAISSSQNLGALAEKFAEWHVAHGEKIQPLSDGTVQGYRMILRAYRRAGENATQRRFYQYFDPAENMTQRRARRALEHLNRAMLDLGLSKSDLLNAQDDLLPEPAAAPVSAPPVTPRTPEPAVAAPSAFAVAAPRPVAAAVPEPAAHGAPNVPTPAAPQDPHKVFKDTLLDFEWTRVTSSVDEYASTIDEILTAAKSTVRQEIAHFGLTQEHLAVLWAYGNLTRNFERNTEGSELTAQALRGFLQSAGSPLADEFNIPAAMEELNRVLGQEVLIELDQESQWRHITKISHDLYQDFYNGEGQDIGGLVSGHFPGLERILKKLKTKGSPMAKALVTSLSQMQPIDIQLTFSNGLIRTVTVSTLQAYNEMYRKYLAGRQEMRSFNEARGRAQSAMQMLAEGKREEALEIFRAVAAEMEQAAAQVGDTPEVRAAKLSVVTLGRKIEAVNRAIENRLRAILISALVLKNQRQMQAETVAAAAVASLNLSAAEAADVAKWAPIVLDVLTNREHFLSEAEFELMQRLAFLGVRLDEEQMAFHAEEGALAGEVEQLTRAVASPGRPELRQSPKEDRALTMNRMIEWNPEKIAPFIRISRDLDRGAMEQIFDAAGYLLRTNRSGAFRVVLVADKGMDPERVRDLFVRHLLERYPDDIGMRSRIYSQVLIAEAGEPLLDRFMPGFKTVWVEWRGDGDGESFVPARARETQVHANRFSDGGWARFDGQKGEYGVSLLQAVMLLLRGEEESGLQNRGNGVFVQRSRAFFEGMAAVLSTIRLVASAA